MKLFHPVRVCDETPSKFVQKSIATKPTIMDMIKSDLFYSTDLFSRQRSPHFTVYSRSTVL